MSIGTERADWRPLLLLFELLVRVLKSRSGTFSLTGSVWLPLFPSLSVCNCPTLSLSLSSADSQSEPPKRSAQDRAITLLFSHFPFSQLHSLYIYIYIRRRRRRRRRYSMSLSRLLREHVSTFSLKKRRRRWWDRRVFGNRCFPMRHEPCCLCSVHFPPRKIIRRAKKEFCGNPCFSNRSRRPSLCCWWAFQGERLNEPSVQTLYI